jgi:hypothetical protein
MARNPNASLARTLLEHLTDNPRILGDEDRRRVMRMLQTLGGRA